MFLVPVTRQARDFSRTLDRLFDDSFDRVFAPSAATETATSRTPALDVAENERAYTVKLEMPGVAKEDVKITIDGRLVTVHAEHARQEEAKEVDRVVYRERTLQSYARTFTLPAEVEQAESGARLEHGVLTLTLPKRGARTAARITVS